MTAKKAKPAKVDSYTEKLTRKMLIIRSLQGDLASLDKEEKEKLAALSAATDEMHKHEEQDLEGDELFRVKFKHKKQLLQRIKRRMDDTKTEFDSLKKLRKQLLDDLIELDKGTLEDSLPLVVQSKLGKDPDNAWKDVPVRHMMNHGLAESIVDHFNQHNLDTLGKVEDFRKKNELTALEGLTESMEKKFDASRDDFLTAYNTFLGGGEEEGDKDDSKDATLADLKLSDEVVAKLSAEGIATLEDLTGYLKKHGQEELKKMLGSRSFEKLKDVMK